MKTNLVEQSVGLYRRLLRLYPQGHRCEYGEWMCQLFRDQCRDAWQQRGSAGLLTVWRRALWDILLTCVSEHWSEINPSENMNDNLAKKSSAILLVVGLAAGLISFSFFGSPWMQGMVLVAALGVGGKAAVDLVRPAVDWKQILWTSLAVMFIFALYMPAWAKATQGATRSDPLQYFTVACVMANPLVAILKTSQFLMGRRKR